MGYTTKTSPDEEAFQIEKNLAKNSLASGDRNAAWQHLHNVIKKLISYPPAPERDALLISSSIKLASVNFALGKSFGGLPELLGHSMKAAERIGDRRSMAMINLHLGRLFYFANRREEAISVFEAGKTEVEALGDDDIFTQSAEFIGLYYFIRGRFREAVDYFERASHSFESEANGHVNNPSGPLWLSYCSAFLGQFHRAIGTLDYYRRVAMEGGDQEIATTLRAVLGIILLGIKKNKEAAFHLSGALQEARKTQNKLAGYFANGGLALHHCLEGRLIEARDWLEQTMEKGAAAGLVHQYASPAALELLFVLHRHGMSSNRATDYASEFSRIMNEPNIHLRGVALRLKATGDMAQKKSSGAIESDLQQSEVYLIQSGDPVQLGKTRLEMARLKLREGDQDGARNLAEKARKDFAGYMDVFFPDDLRSLLALKEDSGLHYDSDDHVLGIFVDVIQELTPSVDFDDLLTRSVKSTNRFFGTERGGIFWFRRNRPGKSPILRGPCNLSRADISSKDFRQSLTLVFRAFHENRPQVFRRGDQGINPSHVKAILCVPFQVEGKVRGVLYHDNSYVTDCFDNFSEHQLIQMAQWLTNYIDHIFEFSRKLKQKVDAQLEQLESTGELKIITQNPVMINILNQVDRIAETGSTVLILGETGVGKELLARRIHQMSSRENKPLVIIDPTIIPENLVESELFGHEKGSFTGADSQKKGLMELADKGTLFIDEVGEIPKSVQVKLLRAIQEKTISRIGGTQSIHSDFRLIAATNRDLAEEVAAGRFREDLYYRLNVIPITLPPLRDRVEDIPFLGRHFLQRFANKYNHRGLKLSFEHESMMIGYNWPGNIRELQNIIERAVLLSTEDQLHIDLPSENRIMTNNQFDDLPSLDDIQRRYIQYVLDKTSGKLSGPGGAAEILGMKRTSLYNRMKKLGLR